VISVRQCGLPGILILTPQRFSDDRGFLCESWSRRTLEEAGVYLPEFVQDNHSLSLLAGTLRGLHYQAPPHAQGKLVRCGRGRLFDVAVDVRRGSPTYGRWFGLELSFENGHQLWIPPGFLHGFVTREPDTEVIYKCTAFYSAGAEGALRWDSVGIDWGLLGDPVLSPKDANAVPFDAFDSPFKFEAAS
jgi:dTDP-4-dehydrorhamnose 3,5-epimerase